MLAAECVDRRWADFAAGVELDEPGECGIDERMIGGAAGEEEIGVGGQVEAAGFAVTFGELDEELAAVFVAEAVDHLVDLRAPGGVALAFAREVVPDFGGAWRGGGDCRDLARANRVAGDGLRSRGRARCR